MATQRPKIGLVSYTTQTADGMTIYAVPTNYIHRLRQYDVVIDVIMPGEPNIESVCKTLDGLMLIGGHDIDPLHYDDYRHDKVVLMDQPRDHTELAAFNAIYQQQKPILGICRGLQLINIARGGSLKQHIEANDDAAVRHQIPPKFSCAHDITIESNTQLYKIYQQKTIEAISWHHQAIDRLGAGVIATAYAADGIIEAIEIPDYPNFLVAVQGHPEIEVALKTNHDILFAAFTQACEPNN